MATTDDKSHSLSAHLYFTCFGGLLLTFCIARLLAINVEQLAVTTAPLATLILSITCALIVVLVAFAAMWGVDYNLVRKFTATLVIAHFLAFAYMQAYIGRAEGSEVVRSAFDVVRHYFLGSPLIAYWLACIIIFRSARALLPITIILSGVIVVGAFVTPGDASSAMRLLAGLVGVAMLFAIGPFIFWISHLSDLRKWFANTPDHPMHLQLVNAKRIHESMFPEPIATGTFQFGYAYRPMAQIGGDFIHVHVNSANDTPNGDSNGNGAFYLTLIDVTGHGISSALTVNRLNAELEQCFALKPDQCPSEALSYLNNYVRVTMAEHGLFATAVCVRVDTENGALTVANAGHPPCFLYSDNDLKPIDADGPMLGVFTPNDFITPPLTIQAQSGDRLVLITDGAVECKSRVGDMLGTDGIHNIIQQSCRDTKAPTADGGHDPLRDKVPDRLLDRADIRKPAGLVQKILRRRMNDHPCALADEIMLSVDDYVQQKNDDDILIATIEMK